MSSYGYFYAPVTTVPTVLDTIQRTPPAPVLIRPANIPTTSRKAWADKFLDFNRETQYLSSVQWILSLGPLRPGDEEWERFSRNSPEYKSPEIQVISSEAEVARYFDQHIAPLCLSTFPSDYKLLQRCQIGPVANTTFTGTIDIQFTFSGYKSLNVAIGEHKRLKVIDAESWKPPSGYDSAAKQQLSRELRGYVPIWYLCFHPLLIKYRYAFEYNCPQIFCFDAERVLAITFPARDRNHIKTVPPVVMVTDVCSDGIFVICRMMTTGFHRILAEHYTVGPVHIGQYVREFRWFDGRPVWKNLQTHDFSWEHPDGWKRKWSVEHRAFYWKKEDEETTHWCTTSFQAA